jgi:preprotein translocase subunit SecD
MSDLAPQGGGIKLGWIRLLAVVFLVLGALTGWFTYATEVNPNSSHHFKLGLDLAGGVYLAYRADVSGLDSGEINDALEALRLVVERRVNSRDLSGVTGVLDPSVTVSESSGLGGVSEYRLIIELPGVTEVEEAKRLIGETPLLEFKLVDTLFAEAVPLVVDGQIDVIPDEGYIATGLTGRFLDHARLEFSGAQGQGGFANIPIVTLSFTEEGADLFAQITREHVGEVLAIFLDGVPIELPVIQEEIQGGTAIITGNFTPETAREVVRNLNLGALPIPIEPISTQTIGPSLGAETLEKGVYAGALGLLAVAFFMVLWYRLPGFIAAIALVMYLIINLAIIKLIPVTLTAAGIAGFILSVGMAVDANILIFERMREELERGRKLGDAIREGFARAWLSIRDGNVAVIITAVIIFYAGTFLTRGFAITLIIGTVISMFTAITITRSLLLSLGDGFGSKIVRALYGQGIRF